MASHLVLRGGTFHFRFRVPPSHQSLVGRKVIKASLRTGVKRLASIRSKRLLSALTSFIQTYEKHDMAGINIPELQQYLREYLDRLLDYDDRNRAIPDMPSPLLAQIGIDPSTVVDRALADPRIDQQIVRDELEAGLPVADYTFARSNIDEFIKLFNIPVEEDTPDYYYIARKVHETVLDAYNVFNLRSVGNVAGEREYLHRLRETIPAPPVAPAPVAPSLTPVCTSTIHEDAERFIDIKLSSGEWDSGSVKDCPPPIRRFVELVGPDIPTASLNRDHMRRYREAMEKLPKSPYDRTKYKDKDVAELIKLDIPKKERLGPKTLDTRFTMVRSFLNWLEEEELIEKAKPLSKILTTTSLKKQRKAEPTRRAFTPEELEKLLCNDDYRRGKFQAACKFWAPLLALFTGARIEEICQLYLDDIREIDGTLCLDINAEDEKDLKTEAGKRQVPVHPFLVEVGLLERVEALRDAGHKHLFHRDTLSTRKVKVPGTDRYVVKLSTNVSQAFTRFRRKWGVGGMQYEKSEAVYHSFRHCLIRWGKLNGIDRRMVKEIVGHEDGEFDDVTADYEGLYPPSQTYRDFISKLDFHKSMDLSHLKGSKWIRKP